MAVASFKIRIHVLSECWLPITAAVIHYESCIIKTELDSVASN